MMMTSKRILKASCVLLCGLSLMSCSLLSPVKTAEPNKYIINKMPANIVKRKKHNKILLVLPIESRPIYNTTQMAYSIKHYQVAYFAQNEWVETPGQMLLPLVVQTLQNTNYYKAIVTTGYAGTYDYALYLQLLNAKDSFYVDPSEFELTVRAQLLKLSTGKIVATKVFFVTQPLNFDTPYSGVVAANKVSAEFLRRLTIFCIRNTR